MYRIEYDTLGPVEVQEDKLWGAQTQRALKFFCISNEKMPYELINAMAHIKCAAAKVNSDLSLIDKKVALAIMTASEEIISGKWRSEFPLSIWQTGSGTQTNMNVNEVIANRASEILYGDRGKKIVHPNDHVNLGQSSNDTFPTAMHIASCLCIKQMLLPALIILKNTLLRKCQEFKEIVKIGRTHLQDAVPITLGQEFSGYVAQLSIIENYIHNSIPTLSELAIGGTAVGTGLNTHKMFGEKMCKHLSDVLHFDFIQAKNKFQALASHEAFLSTHGVLKTLAAALNKIANDIRWLASGPRSGLGELIIPENEPGSSIMPGKINPTQCEAITMIAAQVIGNDVAINFGGASGNFELNVFKPLLIYNFLQSVRILSDGMISFEKYCISGIIPNTEKIKNNLEQSLMLVTALNPKIGYDKSAEVAKKAFREHLSLKTAALELGYLTNDEFDELVVPFNMTK